MLVYLRDGLEDRIFESGFVLGRLYTGVNGRWMLLGQELFSIVATSAHATNRL